MNWFWIKALWLNGFLNIESVSGHAMFQNLPFLFWGILFSRHPLWLTLDLPTTVLVLLSSNDNMFATVVPIHRVCDGTHSKTLAQLTRCIFSSNSRYSKNHFIMYSVTSISLKKYTEILTICSTYRLIFRQCGIIWRSVDPKRPRSLQGDTRRLVLAKFV